MKRFLNKKTIRRLVITITFMLFFIPFAYSYAETKQEYYEKLLSKEFGFVTQSVEIDENIFDKISQYTSGVKYNVILTSDISNNYDIYESLLSNGNLILICDNYSFIVYPIEFSCDENEVDSRQLHNMGSFLKSDGSEYSDIFIIPENLLLSPIGREELKGYITALKRSDEAPNVSEDIDREEEKITNLTKIKEFSQTMTFKIFTIAFSSIVLVTILSGLLKQIVQYQKKVDINFIKNLLNIKNLSMYQILILHILLIMFLVYIPLSLALSIKDGQGISFGYALSYSLDSLNIVNLMEYASTGKFFRILIFFYDATFLILFSFLIIPIFQKVIKSVYLKILNSEIRVEILKYLVPAIIIISVLSISFFKISDIYGFLIFMVVLLLYSFSRIGRKDLKLRIEYSRREKRLLILVSLTIILLGFLWNNWKKDRSMGYKNEDLIGVIDDVVTIPYLKQLGSGALIKEFSFSGSEPVFVNQYLIYSPNHSKVENKNIRNFKKGGSFCIQNGDVRDIVYSIYSNKEVAETLLSSEPSNLFKVNLGSVGSENEIKKDKIELRINLSCKRKYLDTDDIKADIYYLDEKGEIQTDNFTLFYFPGCTQIGKPESLAVEFNPPYVSSDIFFMRLVGVLSSDLNEIKIIFKEKIMDPEYYYKGRGYTVIVSEGMENSEKIPITNYIFGDSYDLSFDMESDDEGKFDISRPINELIREGALKDRFLIWSTKKYLPIRLPD